MRIIDARGQACPQPVILARNAMAGSNVLRVIVDDETAQMNVSRMAEKAGYRVESERKDEGVFLHLARVTDVEAKPTRALAAGKRVVLVTGEGVGRGNDELGRILMRGFLHALNEGEARPALLIFMNSGVRLVAQGSSVLEDLRSLSDQGVQIWACGTCLDYYALKDKLVVGQVSNMYSIAEALQQAENAISI
jgi:selenium metabolism protein YedF